MVVNYTEESIKSLSWHEHIRRRPGMYIGKLGDGTLPEDGIYVLLKEVIDNSIDEFMMGFGKKIEITVLDGKITVRDYGRGIPLGKVVDVVSKINTGGKYDSVAFQKSVGLNGVGTKAVNALSSHFKVQSFRDGESVSAVFKRAKLTKEEKVSTKEKNGTFVEFVPDIEIFPKYDYNLSYIEEMVWNYVFLQKGLTILLNDKEYHSKEGLVGLLKRNYLSDVRYDIIQADGVDIEIAFTHGSSYGETYFSFVNGQNTTHGGTHVAAFKSAFTKMVRDFFKKEYDAQDIRSGLVAAIAIRMQEPVFESQTKTKLGSANISEGKTIQQHCNEFFQNLVSNLLHQNQEIASLLKVVIDQNERERKELQGIKDAVKKVQKKTSLSNPKLKDCRVHLNDKHELAKQSTLFITEGDSASGSITQIRNTDYQAVFSLKGKPENCYGKDKRYIYENKEMYMLIHALDLENSVDNLKYNRVVIATDADADGMHIRLLMMTFFIQYYPEIVQNGHVSILETPLFRVRNRKETIYCYTEKEKKKAITKLGTNVEITRFKGLGEISPSEFENFVGKDMKLIPVTFPLQKEKMLQFYMGKNDDQRREYIIKNIRKSHD